ncbi:MAG: alpha/beta hydrolase [Bacteroidetes bacterium]|nr:alpha/beta hydrolase [Bacteroidota bacterium]
MEFENLNYKFEITKTEIEAGTVIAHTDMGDGEPVVFLHGLGSYIPAWNKNLDFLSKHFRCIAVDLPGYGKSSKILHPATMDYYASVIIELMKILGYDKFTVCGHSMGGVIALKLAIDHSDKINKMVLVAPGGAETYSDDEKLLIESYLNADKIISNNEQQIANNVKVNFQNFPLDAQFMIDDRTAIRNSSEFRLHATIIARSALGVINSDVPYRLDAIRTPALGIFGEHDKLIPNTFVHPWLTPKDIIETFRSRISNFTIKTYDETGHFIQFEQPEYFNRDVLEFILQ